MPETQPPDSSRPVRDAYRAWSDRYEQETAVTTLEERTVGALRVDMADRILLDAGCGIGRRLERATPGLVFGMGIDLVPEMLAAGRARWPTLRLAAGDLRALPLPDGVFNLEWCRLALGHLPEIERAYAELARVSVQYGELVVTDFHADAVRAGHRRTFRDAEGRLVEVEHHVHDSDAHERAAEAAGWVLLERRNAMVGPLVRDFYEGAGRLDLYDAQVGLPLVLLLRFRKR